MKHPSHTSRALHAALVCASLTRCYEPSTTAPSPTLAVDASTVDSPPSSAVVAPPSMPPRSGVVVATSARKHPPPLSGGTLLVTRDDRTAVAADPDFDRVHGVDLERQALRFSIDLRAGDEPGRAVEGRDGVVYVVLRGGGAIAQIDTATGELVARVPVCPAPRGVAYDGANKRLHVACAGGELVSLDAQRLTVLRALRLDPDLRDVAIVGDALWVSRFREAEVIVVDREGAVERTMRPSATDGSEAHVAWRMIPYLDGVAVVHQREGIPSPSSSSSMRPAYYAPQPSCAVGMAPAQVTMFRPGRNPVATPWIPGVVLPVDFAVFNRELVVLSAGRSPAPSIVFTSPSTGTFSGACAATREAPGGGHVVALAASARHGLLTLLREPVTLNIDALNDNHVSVPLSSGLLDDVGYEVFHTSTPQFIACASCHPEGGDDGHTWRLTGSGMRRTPDLRGGVLATAPFHWDGALPTMRALVDEVFVRRMGGAALDDGRVHDLGAWLDALPAPRRSAPVDVAALDRGRAIFERADTGCASCHAGPRLTNNATVDVGTGRAFQVPSLLGLARRAPYMHDGCAATVRGRFSACGGGERHGHTAQLSPSELDDLVAWLESL